MKLAIYLVMALVLVGMTFAASNPYPLYGYTNPNTPVKLTSGSETKIIQSNAEGYYQFELNSDYKQVRLSVMGCSKDIVLPNAPGYRQDLPCSTPVIPVVPIATGIGGLIALYGIGYVLNKYNTKTKLYKLSKSDQIKLLKALGVADKDIPLTESGRVALIMKLKK